MASDPGPAWELAIEASNPSSGGPGVGPSIAARRLDDTEDRALVEPLAPTGRHDDDLMPAIERTAAALSVRPCGLRHIAVSLGPGGYTGIRVAAVTAQAIAEVTGARLAGVPTAAALRRAHRDLPGRVAIALASKRETTHVTVFEAPYGVGDVAGRVIGVIGADGLEAVAPDVLVADRFLPAGMSEAAARLGIAVVEPVYDARSVLAVAGAFEVAGGEGLTAIYPREPEAVRKWRERPSPRNRD